MDEAGLTMSTVSFFNLFTDPNLLWVMGGSVLLGATAGIIGTFAVLRKRALTGDAIAHAALPGITTAFLITHSRSPFIIVTGALISSVLGMLCMEFLIRKTKIKEDSALAIVLSLFFALGIFQLTYIQKLGVGSQAGLDKLLFGQAASLVSGDVLQLGVVAACILVMVALFFRQLRLISFDSSFARASGLPARGYELLLGGAVVSSVVIGLQLVGVVLMAALIITPAAAARYWTHSLGKMLFLSGLFGAVAGIFGALISALAPRMPTGPWIVIVLSGIFFLSILFAPSRGMVFRFRAQQRRARRTKEENILRSLYKFEEQAGVQGEWLTFSALLEHRPMPLGTLEKVLFAMEGEGFVATQENKVKLTSEGRVRGERLTRLHRLWELYLTERINLPSDHVHSDAEEIEHILTPELEALLLEELGKRTIDPHGRTIPQRNHE